MVVMLINKLILNVFWGNYLDMGVVFGANTFRKPNYLKKRSWFCQMASGNLLNLRTILLEEKLLMEQGMALDTQDLETPMSSPFFLSLKILTLIKPFQEMLRRGSSLNLKIVHFFSYQTKFMPLAAESSLSLLIPNRNTHLKNLIFL